MEKSVGSLTFALGIAGSLLTHGLLLSLPLPERPSVQPPIASSTPDVGYISLKPFPRKPVASANRVVPRRATPSPKAVTQIRQQPARRQLRPTAGLRPRSSPLPTSAAVALPASPPPIHTPQPSIPTPSPTTHTPPLATPSNSVTLFSDFPQANQAELCGTQQGDCWHVSGKRWDSVQQDLAAKLEEKGQELRDLDLYDDPAFRVFGVYEDGRLKAYVHLISIDQTVAYVLSEDELTRDAALARIKPDAT